MAETSKPKNNDEGGYDKEVRMIFLTLHWWPREHFATFCAFQVISKHPDMELAQLRFLVNHPDLDKDVMKQKLEQLQKVSVAELLVGLIF